MALHFDWGGIEPFVYPQGSLLELDLKTSTSMASIFHPSLPSKQAVLYAVDTLQDSELNLKKTKKSLSLVPS